MCLVIKYDEKIYPSLKIEKLLIEGWCSMKGFIDFIKKQGVIGLAIAFILGGAILRLVTSLVNDIISPVLALFLGNLENLNNAYFTIGSARIMWGSFLNAFIDFIILALIIYFVFKALKLDRLDNTEKNNV